MAERSARFDYAFGGFWFCGVKAKHAFWRGARGSRSLRETIATVLWKTYNARPVLG